MSAKVNPWTGQAAKAVAAPPADNSGDGLRRAFFPISDPSSLAEGEEMDEAEAYLLSVRLEEASLPNVVKAHNPYRLQSDLESNIGLKKGSGSIYIAAPDPTAPSLAVTDRHPYRPSEAWRKVFLSHFVDLRENLTHPSTRPNPSTPGFSTSVNPPAHYLPIPGDRDSSSWRDYILGAKRRKTAVSTETVADAPPPSTVSQPAVLEDDADEEEMMNDLDDEEAGMNDAAEDDMQFDDWEAGGEEEDQYTGVSSVLALMDDDEDSDRSSDEDEVGEGRLLVLEPEQDRHRPKEPSLTLVQRLSEPALIHLLRHMTHWIEPVQPLTSDHLLSTQPGTASAAPTARHTALVLPPTFPALLSRWALPILARVSIYLDADSISHLRSLARGCLSVIRSQLERAEAASLEDDGGIQLGSSLEGVPAIGGEAEWEERMGCWMVWEVVIGIWGQKDLRSEEEALFAGRGWAVV